MYSCVCPLTICNRNTPDDGGDGVVLVLVVQREVEETLGSLVALAAVEVEEGGVSGLSGTSSSGAKCGLRAKTLSRSI